jgi:predicted TIM-barrel enzyme
MLLLGEPDIILDDTPILVGSGVTTLTMKEKTDILDS